MTHLIHCRRVLGLTELKRNPVEAVASGEGEPVAVLSYNEPAFYCVPSELFERMKFAFEQFESGKSA